MVSTLWSTFLCPRGQFDVVEQIIIMIMIKTMMMMMVMIMTRPTLEQILGTRGLFEVVAKMH